MPYAITGKYKFRNNHLTCTFLKPFKVSKTDDLEKFYPTRALVTAYDIIFFWVSRMIMAGLEFTGKSPFHDIYIHGLIRDKQGRKVYTIVNRGNTGTIDGVPFIINSGCGDLTSASADDYLMAYGPMSNYELAIFSDIDARKSTDYKFKQGQVAYRADIFAGGAVVAKNGFLRVKKGS